MRRVYKVKIGDVWLTEGAAETGKKCFLQIVNIAKLRESYKRTPIESVDETIIIQTFETKDVPFAVLVGRLPEDVGEMLIDLYNDSAASGEIIPFTATGGGGADFNFDCEIVSIDYKDVQSNIWDDVLINLIKK